MKSWWQRSLSWMLATVCQSEMTNWLLLSATCSWLRHLFLGMGLVQQPNDCHITDQESDDMLGVGNRQAALPGQIIMTHKFNHERCYPQDWKILFHVSDHWRTPTKSANQQGGSYSHLSPLWRCHCLPSWEPAQTPRKSTRTCFHGGNRPALSEQACLLYSRRCDVCCWCKLKSMMMVAYEDEAECILHFPCFP